MTSVSSPYFGDDEDLVFDFSFDLDASEKIKLIRQGLSNIDRLWRSVRRKNCASNVSPAAFSLRVKFDGENVIWKEPALSFYEMIIKNDSDLQGEADSFMEFMINEGPFDVKSDVPVLLCLNGFFSCAEYSHVIYSFIDGISKTSPQKEQHTKAYHWDFEYVKQQDSLEIRSIMAHHSIAYLNNCLELNKEVMKQRKCKKLAH
ncbi:hypothetical protein [Klebsiella quasipneumoniae]|uniref:hypothetical protein n=1 Tax=Klebsiella quasipneumoniae TaxID=1463165 RepID=UPI002E78B709|nr:hypothetical protein [Klebsiella quasipneumoniae]